MQKARRHRTKRLRQLVGVWVQELFHSSVRSAFHLSLTCPDLLRILLWFINLHVRDYHPLWSHFPRCSISFISSSLQSYYPVNAETITVWAFPRSLAATGGITFVFFSCRYLDVSVPCVCLPYGIICLQHIGLSHSEISASKVICT